MLDKFNSFANHEPVFSETYWREIDAAYAWNLEALARGYSQPPQNAARAEKPHVAARQEGFFIVEHNGARKYAVNSP